MSAAISSEKIEIIILTTERPNQQLTSLLAWIDANAPKVKDISMFNLKNEQGNLLWHKAIKEHKVNGLPQVFIKKNGHELIFVGEQQQLENWFATEMSRCNSESCETA